MMLKTLAVCCALAVSAAAYGATTLQAPNGAIRLQVSAGAAPSEVVSIRVNGKWVLALTSEQAATRVVALGKPNVPHDCMVRNISAVPDGLLVRGDCGAGKFEQRVRLTSQADELSVTVRFFPSNGLAINSVEDRYDFAPGRRAANAPGGPVDFVWSQNIKNEADDDVPEWSFKSPVVMLQQGPVFAALMPKLNERISKPLAMDLDVTTNKLPWLSYGGIPSQPYGHSYFRRSITGSPKVIETSTPAGQQGVIEYQYSIVAFAQRYKLGYQRVVHLLWEQQGHAELLRSEDAQLNVTRPWLVTFQDWARDTWIRYADEVYSGFDCGGKQCGTLASFRNPGGALEWRPRTRRVV